MIDKFSSYRSRKRIMFKYLGSVKYFILSAVLLLAFQADRAFASASAPNPLCVMADDFGNLMKGRYYVSASGKGSFNNGVFTPDENNGWLDTGMDLQSDYPLQIRTIGEVDLCTIEGIGVVNKSITDVTVEEWQSTGVYVEKSSRYIVSATGGWSKGGTKSDVQDRDFSDGRKIYAYLGESKPSGTSSRSWEIISKKDDELVADRSGYIYVWYEDGAGGV